MLHRYDQAGVVMIIDCDNWIKASCEWESPGRLSLGCVVTRGGRSDWSTRTVRKESPGGPEPKGMVEMGTYRVLITGENVLVAHRFAGDDVFEQVRVCPLPSSAKTGFEQRVLIGPYACSPQGNGEFKAQFTEFIIETITDD